jgi:hypothetical protein
MTISYCNQYSPYIRNTTDVQSPEEAKDLSSSVCVQTGCEAHPRLLFVRYRGSFPGDKARSVHDTDRSPHLAPR